MKTFLTTAATALILGTSAYAETDKGAFSEMTFDSAINLNASEVIGKRVYASEAQIENETTATNGTTEWDDIGEINEIVLTRDGSTESVIVGVGGFLGMGEKDVVVSMDQLKFVSDGEDNDDYFIVINASTAGIQDAPAYEKRTEANADAATQTTAMDTADNSVLDEPKNQREGYMEVSSDELNTEDLTGTHVYGSNDEDVGEISELLVTENGKLDRAIIDVGGFLGMGEKPVAVTMDELEFLRDDNGNDLRVYINTTEDALESLPEYEG